MTFKGLTGDTFAAYAPEKWSSNVYNLPRMKAKDALVALCDVVQQRLAGELAGLGRGASDEVPNILNQKKVDAQWAYWFRDQEARKALASFLEKTPLDQTAMLNLAVHDKHIIMAVVLREAHLWVGLRVAPGAAVDRRNMAEKLAKAWERERLVELLKELPEGAAAGLEGAVTPTGELTLDALAQLGESLSGSSTSWLLGHAVERAEAVALGADLADHVARWLGSLVPLYRFLAWTRDNDFIEAAKKIQEEKAQKRKAATSYSKGDKVRIVGGMFSGKVGIVQATDTKAQVRVQVGKMSVVVSGGDLIPA